MINIFMSYNILDFKPKTLQGLWKTYKKRGKAIRKQERNMKRSQSKESQTKRKEKTGKAKNFSILETSFFFVTIVT